ADVRPRRDDRGPRAAQPWLRGVPAHRRHVGSPPDVPLVRPGWLLRLVEEPTRHATLLGDAASHRPLAAAGRNVALVLRRRAERVSRPRVAAATRRMSECLKGAERPARRCGLPPAS